MPGLDMPCLFLENRAAPRGQWILRIPKLEPKTVGKLGVKCFLCMVFQKEPLLSTPQK